MRIVLTLQCPVCKGDGGFNETVVYDSGKKIKEIHEKCLNCGGNKTVKREYEDVVDYDIVDS